MDILYLLAFGGICVNPEPREVEKWVKKCQFCEIDCSIGTG